MSCQWAVTTHECVERGSCKFEAGRTVEAYARGKFVGIRARCGRSRKREIEELADGIEDELSSR